VLVSTSPSPSARSHHPRRLERRTVAEATADEIRHRILSGEFRDGQPLRQDVLAEELGVSRIPVREALQRLESEGLVVHQPHKGCVVTSLSPEEIEELFDLRAMLEPELIRHAVARMTPADLDEAQRVLDEYDRVFEHADVHVWGELNTEYHLALYAPSERKRTMEIVRSLLVNTDRYTRLLLVLTDGVPLARHDHGQLMALCRAGKGEEAAAVLKDHIVMASRNLIAAIQRRNGS
jgi:DNA-binding GntR family transcriptional regulator